ncbi:MAG TPA: AAA family ATPase, partial [Polyangia bacterium]|nr:AAA family ATPase [Polyangia bacterium]
VEVLMNKQRKEPARPRPSDASQPDLELENLCLDLLRFEPSERPTGPEILHRLGVQQSSHRPSQSLTQTAPFVGRSNELNELSAAFTRSRSRAVTVHVQGESGVGKSALVRRFAEVLKQEQPEVVILGGHCYERESVPYKAVDGLIDALSRYLVRLPKAEAASILPRQAALLTQVFPVLSRVEPFAEAPRLPEVRDPQELRSRLFGALRELLGRLADRRPLVLTIDDLQWADADSLSLLAEVMRPPDAPALLLVATVRDRSAGGADSGPTSTSTSAIQSDRTRLQLQRMPSDEAQTLAQLLIARAVGRPTLDARAVAHEAGGHPLFIDELIRHSYSGAPPALHLEDALWARIQQLETPARTVLELTALAGGRLVQKTAMQAASLDAGTFSRLVGMLRVAHLVRTTGTRGSDFIEPYHDRVRAAVLSHLQAVQARAQHRRMALALEAAEHSDPEALLRHWREAGERARAAGYAALAAEKAVRALAFDRAAELYGECLTLGLTRDRDDRDLRVKRAHALVNAGRGAEAAVIYAEAAVDASSTDALDLRRRAAEQLLRSGHVDEGLDALRTVLGAVGMQLADTPARALSSLLWHRARIRLRGLKFKERTEGQLAADKLTKIDTCWSVATGLSMVDTIRSSDFQARHLLLALEAGEPYRIARALAIEGALVATAGEKAAARVQALLTAATELARRIGHPHAIGMAEIASGVAAYQTGRWAEALARCEAADRLFREGCVGVAWEIVTAQLFRLNALFYLGELSTLQRDVVAAIQEVEERGDLYASTTLRIRALSFASLAGDDVDGARRRADAAMRQWTPQPRGFHAQHYYHMVALANADLYAGEGAAAWQRVNEQWRELTRSLFLRVQVVRVEAHCLRGRAALAAAALAPSEAKPLLHAAVESARQLEKEGVAWARGLALLLRAGIARQSGDETATSDALTEAARVFDGQRMRLFAWVARRELDPAAADAWMRMQQIGNPARQSALLAPGL